MARPILNEVKQHLEWPVFDRKGQGLLLQVECSNGNEKRIANMEALVTGGAEIHLVVVKIEGSQRGIILRPLSILIAEAGAISPVSLDFANGVPTRTSVLVARIKRMLVGDSAPPVTEGSLSARALAPVLSVVECWPTQADRR